mmetsp:Transcript_23861/g.38349  ORF Transcript_23861/g.38349 Transcript_23861/m.38349 type:complete len:196 (+) Transcript_23861:87-674(+)
MSTVKIAMVGPKGIGKSVLSNALAGDFSSYGDMPTVGVRIREIRVPLLNDYSTIPVELWDVSGDIKYEHCWPAITDGLNGLIIVYNPKNQMQSKEVSLWMEAFCKNSDVTSGQVVIWALNLPTDQSPPPIKYEGKTGTLRIPIVGVSISENPKANEDIQFNGDVSWQSFADACYRMHPDNQELEDEDDAFLDGNN